MGGGLVSDFLNPFNFCEMKRKCDFCQKEYQADQRNIKRGWGLCCSKSCAASKRERAKPGYNIARVAMNNIRRETWLNKTCEGYRVVDSIAYDEFGEPMYNLDQC